MSADKPPRNPPRFLPTLTEIVYPPGAPRKTRRATPALEETLWFVMQRVDLVLERRIREEADAMVHSVVDERIQAASARLRQELEPVVRQAVMDAMSALEQGKEPK
jgi:C4-dicarboxylate-specific signal transduction histidine kinase